MITFIKTAIVTIIISFISGWLLDHYKSLAPKILCNIGNGIPLKVNSRKVYAYIVTVTNISNKIIHELTINIQSLKNNLQVADTKITKGLKFNSSTKNNVVDISIPFLSKKDKFSVTLYVENEHELPSKPVVTVRSPEKFKEVRSLKGRGILSSLFDVPQNINDTTPKKSKRNKIAFINKKVLISLVSIMLLVIIGVLGKSYLKKMFTNAKAVNNTTVQQQSNSNTEPSYKSSKNTGSKTSSGITTQNTDSKTSSGTTTTTGGTNSKTPSDETTKNTDSKTSSDKTVEDTNSKTSSDETTTNTNSKISSGTTTEDTNSNSNSNTNTNTNSNSDKATQNSTN